MTTKQKIAFEQRMFDFIVTRDVAAAAINCMDVAEEMIELESDPMRQFLTEFVNVLNNRNSHLSIWEAAMKLSAEEILKS